MILISAWDVLHTLCVLNRLTSKNLCGISMSGRSNWHLFPPPAHINMKLRFRREGNQGDDVEPDGDGVVAVKSRTKGRSLLILFGRHFAGH